MRGQIVEFEEVSSKGKTSAENLKVQHGLWSGSRQPITAASIRLPVAILFHTPSSHLHRTEGRRCRRDLRIGFRAVRPPEAIPHDRRRLCALAALPFAKGQINCLTKGRIGSSPTSSAWLTACSPNSRAFCRTKQPTSSRKAVYRCSGPNFLAEIVGERARPGLERGENVNTIWVG
jgi:hypothetical protein